MAARPSRARGASVVKRVLEVTLEELGRVGVGRLSLPRVATLAGINKTSIYRRWSTKQELVTAALGLAVPLENELPDNGDVELDLVALTQRLGEFIASPAGRGLLRAVFADGDSPLADRLANAMRKDSARLAPRLVLVRAVKRGELRPDADLETLLHVAAGAVLHRAFVERKSADQRWARRLTRLLLDGARSGGSKLVGG